MLEFLLEPFRGASVFEVIRSLIDIALVSTLVYWGLRLVRGTASLRVVIGFGLVWAVFVLAERFELRTVSLVFSTLFFTLSPLVVLAIVLFQDDIRRGLARMTRWRRLSRIQEAETVEAAVAAVEQLAREHIGAIIVFEGEAELEAFTQGGIEVDATVTKELLYAIFVPAFRNPTHDGAVVIKNLRIARAGVFLPSTKKTDLAPEMGTRHRAAIGITEATDAVSIVVSEERGTISFCEDGAITFGVSPLELREILLARFQYGARREPGLLDRLLGRRPVARPERATQVGRRPIRSPEIAEGSGKTAAAAPASSLASAEEGTGE